MKTHPQPSPTPFVWRFAADAARLIELQLAKASVHFGLLFTNRNL